MSYPYGGGGGYPPQQGGYPPQQGGYPPQQGGYPPQQGAGGYPPPQGGYPAPVSTIIIYISSNLSNFYI